MIHWKSPWRWERLKAEREEGVRGWLDGITDAMNMNLSKLRETVRDREAWRATVHGVAKSQTLLSDWTISSGFETGDCWDIRYITPQHARSMKEAWEYSSPKTLMGPLKHWSFTSCVPFFWEIPAIWPNNAGLFCYLNTISSTSHQLLVRRVRAESRNALSYKIRLFDFLCLSANKYLYILSTWFNIYLLCNKPLVWPPNYLQLAEISIFKILNSCHLLNRIFI